MWILQWALSQECEFEAYGVDGYLDDFYVKGNTYAELVENIASSKGVKFLKK